MSNFKFVKGSTTIEFDASALPITITRERSQNVIESENNDVFVYDRGFTKTFFGLKVSTERSNNTFADISSINDFIQNVVVYRLHTFELHPPDIINLGSGDGVEVTVRWWGDVLNEVQDRVQIYDYDMMLRLEK